VATSARKINSETGGKIKEYKEVGSTKNNDVCNKKVTRYFNRKSGGEKGNMALIY
jgi:hypothetical protein